MVYASSDLTIAQARWGMLTGPVKICHVPRNPNPKSREALRQTDFNAPYTDPRKNPEDLLTISNSEKCMEV